MQQLSKAKVKQQVLAGQRAMHMRDPRKKHLDFPPLCGNLIAAHGDHCRAFKLRHVNHEPFFLSSYHCSITANMEQIRPSLKRPRADEENAIRDPNFYAEDGNIVLAAKDTDGTVYFRLHRSILIRHSPVFKDMFSMPTPSEDSADEGGGIADQYDGVPLVEMAGDSSDALRSLIALLYDPACVLSDSYPHQSHIITQMYLGHP
jgi:hypothetical protein